MTDEGVRSALQTAKNIIMQIVNKKIIQKKSERDLPELSAEIARTNDVIKIGMRKEEIAIIWAMRRLGYSPDDANKVVCEARKAYGLEDGDSSQAEE